MFSRLYQSARALFADITQNEKIQPAKVVEPLRDETMVTTRQRHSQEAVREEINDENSINVYVPSSNSRRQKSTSDEDVVVLSDEDGVTFTPTSTRKRKRLPVRAKDAESPEPAKTRPVVEIPAKKISPEPDYGNDIPIENEVVVTQDKNEERDAETVKSLENSKHHRFGSEKAEDGVLFTAREVGPDEENTTLTTAAVRRTMEDSEEGEDDAPEAIGIQAAAKSVKLKDRDAAKAVKGQLSATRKRRKERDYTLKQQAESSKKRKLEADVPATKQLAESSPKKDSLAQKVDLDMAKDEGPSMVEKGSTKHDIPSLSGKRSLPGMLPAEYLEDTEPQEVILLDELPRKKAKKTKFGPAEKDPKDRRIGGTTYRVTKSSSTNLAPKSSSQARNTKESWLQGRPGKGVGINRRSFTKGFFKK